MSTHLNIYPSQWMFYMSAQMPTESPLTPHNDLVTSGQLYKLGPNPPMLSTPSSSQTLATSCLASPTPVFPVVSDAVYCPSVFCDCTFIWLACATSGTSEIGPPPRPGAPELDKILSRASLHPAHWPAMLHIV